MNYSIIFDPKVLKTIGEVEEIKSSFIQET
jgi:hypothetical protein